MQKIPYMEYRRRPSDELPTLILFGTSPTDVGVAAEAHCTVSKVRAGTVVRSGKERLRLPAMTPGFEISELRLSRA
jgi:hypothetical protein